MYIWKIWGTNLPILEIKAECFDEAIKKARKIDKNYDTGKIKE